VKHHLFVVFPVKVGGALDQLLELDIAVDRLGVDRANHAVGGLRDLAVPLP
jgi:hypothetical protein